MKFQLAINLERMNDGIDMQDVARHTLEMVQMADQAGFNIVWAAEHHALEMTIAPNPFQILTWWAHHTAIPSGSALLLVRQKGNGKVAIESGQQLLHYRRIEEIGRGGR